MEEMVDLQDWGDGGELGGGPGIERPIRGMEKEEVTIEEEES